MHLYFKANKKKLQTKKSLHSVFCIYIYSYLSLLVLFASSCGFMLLSGIISFQNKGPLLVFLTEQISSQWTFSAIYLRFLNFFLNFLCNSFGGYKILGWLFCFVLLCFPSALLINQPFFLASMISSIFYSYLVRSKVFRLSIFSFSLLFSLPRIISNTHCINLDHEVKPRSPQFVHIYTKNLLQKQSALQSSQNLWLITIRDFHCL